MKNCNCNADTITDGSGQLQRYLKALDPSYVQIDGRSLEDILVFAKRYAAQIRFYDIPESKVNDGIDAAQVSWREFFRRDMAVIAASLAVTDISAFKKEFEEVRNRLELHPAAAVYGALFAPIAGMLKKIDRWYSVAIPKNPLFDDLKLLIESSLKGEAQKIIAYKEGFKYVDPKFDLKIDLKGIENEAAWGLNETIDPDPGIYNGATDEEKLLNASLFVEDIFHSFYSGMLQLLNDSARYMHFALETYPAHQPHMALFITFLELFRKAQDQMNGLSEKMLDFYYKEVLQLKTKPSVADKAHIVFELAKDVAAYDVAPGTELKAGKDNSGKDIVYKTIDDLVVNQAKVKELKTIFIEKQLQQKADGLQLVHTMYARPVANSADGLGAAFSAADPKWPTFGIGSPEKSAPQNICDTIDLLSALSERNDQSGVGFAVASPQLLLQGGKRLITIKFSNAAPLLARQAELGDKGESIFDIWFTGEKGWFKIDSIMPQSDQVLLKKYLPHGAFSPESDNIETSYFVNAATGIVQIYLPASEQSILGYDAKLHKDFSFSTIQPVMQVMLNPAIDLTASIYKNLSAKDILLKVQVGSINPKAEVIRALKDPAEIAFLESQHFDGLTKVVLQNDTGLLAVGKPFDPFTAYPSKGKSFYIGSEEIFNKPLGELAVNLQKTDDDADVSKDGAGDLRIAAASATATGGRQGHLSVSVLHRKLWDPLSTVQGDNFTVDTLTKNILHHAKLTNGTPVGSEKVTLARTPLLPVKEWQPQTEKGFIRVTNLHTTKGNMELRQAQAISFEMKDVSLNYISALQGLDAAIDEFYHVYPFGVVPVYIQNAPPKIEKNEEEITATLEKIKELRTKLLQEMKKRETAKDLISKAGGKEIALSSDVTKRKAASLMMEKFTDQEMNILDEMMADGVNTDDLALLNAMEKALSPGKDLAATKSTGSNWTVPKYSYNIDIIKKVVDGWNYKPAATIVGSVLDAKVKAVDYKTLDERYNNLLVDNGSLLLPQFTWLSPYEQYNNNSGNLANAGTATEATREAALNKLMLDASGLMDKVTGGANQYSALVQEEGMLFIGLEKAQPLQMISILFQFAEGSAEDEDNDTPVVHWSYLTNNEWRPLKDEYIVSDGTMGFQATGIVKVELPADASNNNSIISSGLHWLCASVTSNSKRIPMLINVVTQAVLAAFQDNDNDQVHFDKALAAGSISKLAVAASQISKVMQPFASFDGKHKEIGKEFYTRASERLRHKNRAITPWDYEHMVLDRFPSIYKVKCISHTDPNCICREGNDYSNKKLDADNCCGPQIAPGHVLIVPIADLKNRNAVNPLQPKTSRRTLLDIEAYMKKYTSPFVHVHAKNPVYEQVLVFFRVQFTKGSDKGYYLKQLNGEIVQYLTPWAFDENSEMKFGQKIYASSIINFIEERKYVDFITDFLMVVCRNGCCPDAEEISRKSKDADSAGEFLEGICGCSGMELLLQDAGLNGEIIAKPSTVRSILVSVPQHIIVPYEEPAELTPCAKRKKLSTKTETKPEAAETPKPVVPEKPPVPPVAPVAPIGDIKPANPLVPTDDITIKPANPLLPKDDIAIKPKDDIAIRPVNPLDKVEDKPLITGLKDTGVKDITVAPAKDKAPVKPAPAKKAATKKVITKSTALNKGKNK